MLPEFDFAPWLEHSQHALATIGNFLKEGSSTNRGYELFRLLLLPLLWPWFAFHWLKQFLLLKANKDIPITWPRVSGILWLLPLWLASMWQSPDNGLYLVSVAIIGVHLCLWYAGMFRWILKPYHLGLAAVAMVAGLHGIYTQLSLPRMHGVPQQPILVQSPSAELLAKTLMHQCYSDTGCQDKMDMASRVTVRRISPLLTPLVDKLSANNCYIAGHSPLGLVYCPGILANESIRHYLGTIFADLPSAKCKRLSWVHESWQPRGFWPDNPPLALLATQRESYLECPRAIGAFDKPYAGAVESGKGSWVVPAQEAAHHDWESLRGAYAGDILNAPGRMD